MHVGHERLEGVRDWCTIVFGGVLGDHPPRDRPATLRKKFKNIRNLGYEQLATDTAVLVTRFIINNQVPLKDIPMIKKPTIKGKNKNQEKTCIQMEGLSLETTIFNEQMLKKDRKKIYEIRSQKFVHCFSLKLFI